MSKRNASRRSRSPRTGMECLEDRRLMAADLVSPTYQGIGLSGLDHDHLHPAHVAPPANEGEMGGAAAAGEAGQGPSALMGGALFPLSSIPVLNSFLGATATLFLDFNGHVDGGGTTPVYDADGDASTFSDQELDFIHKVWQVVAEDFAPFKINVTTVQPSVLAPGVAESAANKVALRIAIGGTHPDGLGGYGYFDSFSNSVRNVAYVYAQGKTDPIPWGTAVSHEAGHSFGLRHLQVANFSTDNSAIMAQFFSTGVSTWQNNINDLGNLQDDMAMLARSTNGFGYRADDHAGTIAGATPLLGSGTSFTGSGIISTTADVDVFSLATAEPRSMRITVEGDSLSQNLDAVLELRDASGAVLVTSNPGESLDASLVADTTSQLYLAVKSTGEYGRVGQYTIKVEESLPGLEVVTSKGPHATSESGRSEKVTLTLQSRPTSDVTFAVASSDMTEGSVSTGSVTFTPTNWFVPQTVTITGVEDGVADRAVGYTVSLASPVSADPSYNGLVDPADLNLVNLDDTPGHVYWIRSALTEDMAVVERSSLAGESYETVLDVRGTSPAGSHSPLRMAIDPTGDKMYWIDTKANTINRANLDGSQSQVVLTRSSAANGITVDAVNRKLYWTDSVNHKIQRSNLDGSGVEDVITSGLGVPAAVEVDASAGKLYWADASTFSISRANLDGSGAEVVVQAVVGDRTGTLALDLAGGKIYFNLRENFQLNRLYRANLDGSQRELLVDLNAVDPTVPNPVVQALAIDHAGGRMMWTDSISNRLFSADLDGSNVAVVMEGLTNFRGLAVRPALPGVTVSPMTGLTTTEAGGSATFTVVLNAPPTADVVIPVGSSDTTEGLASVASLTFTPTNWDVPQTVTITGVDDTVYDQTVSYAIILGSALSSDAAYQGLNATDVSVVNIDNDPAPTKFYVVDDATQNRTYEYSAQGTAVENYALNSGNSAPRGAATTAVGDKTWVIDANRKVYVYNSSGTLLGSWTAGTMASNAKPEGIATNGTDVWIVDAASDKVYRYAGAASRLSGSQNAASNFSLNSGNKDSKGITTDGVHLWTVNDASSSDKVFKYTLAGALSGSWIIASANKTPTGLTIDPASPQHIWIVDSGTDRVYQYDNAVSRTSGSQGASTSFALAAGNTNPQGIADPPPAMTFDSLNESFRGPISGGATRIVLDGWTLPAVPRPRGRGCVPAGDRLSPEAIANSKLLLAEPVPAAMRSAHQAFEELVESASKKAERRVEANKVLEAFDRALEMWGELQND